VEQGDGLWAWVRRKPFALWVIAGGLVYMSLALLYLALPLAIQSGVSGGGGFVVFGFLFVALFLISGAFSLREKRWAYVLAVTSSVILLLLFGLFMLDSLKNPADSSFSLAISGIPGLLLVIAFSILALVNAKTGLTQKRYLATPLSSGGLATIAVIGFVIGGLIVGAIGSGVILRNISAGTADVEIVMGAQTVAMAFTPQTFHVTLAAGGKVMWINKDTTSHTVTSNTTGLFDSPLLSTGATWSYTFTAAGTYPYHCTPHPQMWGVIVVS
jgi:plastocyanin